MQAASIRSIAIIAIQFISLSSVTVVVHGLSQPQQQQQLLPSRPDEIVRQAASAVRKALDDGIHRQTLRIPLSEVMYSDKEEGFVADRAIGWQGGPQETLRYLSPLASQLLQEIRPNVGGLPPRVSEQILLDFDGSSLVTAESPSGPLDDIQALLQPNTDDYYSKTIATIEEQFSDTPGKPKRLFLLVNPAWRNRDSWGFFGGQRAQTQILERYTTTYALDQFIVKNEQMSRLCVYPDDWCVFVKDADKNDKYLGSFKDKPDYAQMEEVLVRRASGSQS
mmetsp:Transcript_12560/g.20925  ORF Transcript_12560/g.20925 Transcript_12560/m.20925 type:complete len:279 (+) Transcript_12560:38-874(+)|eukprot:CAMPEP_0119007666 /NCGR_PEP_ID=MMETSP1176-20130426/3167_1 /TAXON_ID=265551 /ORGANISM="Synedropsis recta cf, Strain CCMP1620" /LENGTH=278 /DNA_ID=CAMNT_0006959859 /DNA_START=37 /DNA_END=873 /DNA_ORIENTATION=-